MRYPFYPYKVDSEFLEVVSYGIHEGVDINGLGGGNTDCGTLLFPITNCKVVHTSTSSSNYGNLVVIEITGSFGTYWVRYAHCDKILVKVGDVVDRGTPIATMGSTGNSTACHLHFDLFKRLPPQWRWYKNNRQELEKYLVHPLSFIKTYKNIEGVKGGSVSDDPLKVCMSDREKFWKERDTTWRAIADMWEEEVKIESLDDAIQVLSDIKAELNRYQEELNKKASVSPVVEAVKEPTRWFVLGLISFVVAYVLDQITTVPQTEVTLLLTLILRGVDKYIHEYTKLNKPKEQVKGLLPF